MVRLANVSVLVADIAVQNLLVFLVFSISPVLNINYSEDRGPISTTSVTTDN